MNCRIVSLLLCMSISGFAAITFALCNSLFVKVYTEWIGRPIDWPPVNDVFLGVWLIVVGIFHCHNVFVLQTKRAGFMRYVFFIEGLVFVASALLTAERGGLPAIILCSVVCSILFSGAYGTWRTSLYLEVPVREIGFRWLIPMGRVLALFGPIALAAWWLFKRVDPPILRLALNALVSSSLGFYVFLRFGLSRSFQKEMLERAPRKINPLLRRVFPGPAQ